MIKLSVKKNSKKEQKSNSFHLKGKIFFLTYKGISDTQELLDKESLRCFLLNNPRDLKVRPIKYIICRETYEDNSPHFHVILAFSHRKCITNPHHFDCLGIHPNIQTMRNLKAALNYVYKEDPEPITNMNIDHEYQVLMAQKTTSLYELLKKQMIKSPMTFDPIKYMVDHNLDQEVCKANYTKSLRLLKQVQQTYCNKALAQRPGFKTITRQLILSKLTPEELTIYDSWPGYQTIVDYLNTMVTLKGARQQKSRNLLITGSPNTGKSALVWQRNPLVNRTSLLSYCSIYPMGMSNWFPNYNSDVYHAIYWNEAKLTSYSYDVILKLLDGSPVDLPAKGGNHKKVDNPLVIMTSNMTLDELISQKFGYNKFFLKMAHANLSVRIQNVIIPEGYNLFLLQKLLIPR